MVKTLKSFQKWKKHGGKEADILTHTNPDPHFPHLSYHRLKIKDTSNLLDYVVFRKLITDRLSVVTMHSQVFTVNCP